MIFNWETKMKILVVVLVILGKVMDLSQVALGHEGKRKLPFLC